MKTLFCILLFASFCFAKDTLVFSGVIKDGQDNVDGMRNPSSVAVSPDNKNVYITSIDDDALVVFNRDTSTGALTYSIYFKDGQDGVDGLNGARSIAISPDNKNVYGIGTLDNALAVFNRDIATGALTYSTFLIDEQDGVEGLSYAYSIAVSPDSQKVYAIGQGDSALAVFDRNVETGALKYRTYFIDSKNGVTGLKSPTSVTVSPDNKNVYVTGSGDNAVAIFKVVHTVPISAPSDIPIKQQTYFSASSKGRFYTIVFNAKASGCFILSLLNAQGKLVKKVMNNSMTAGNHIVKADFSDVQSGIYFLCLADGIKTQAIKIVIAKQE